MAEILAFIKETIGYVFQAVILVFLLFMLLAYFGLPVKAGMMVKSAMEEKIDRNGNGVYLIWGATFVAGILALIAVQGLVSLIATIVYSDATYLNTMFMNFFTKTVSGLI